MAHRLDQKPKGTQDPLDNVPSLLTDKSTI